MDQEYMEPNSEHMDPTSFAAMKAIRIWGDPVLRAKALPITDFSDLDTQVQHMAHIMDAANGAGLAAPQLGLAQQLFVYHPDRNRVVALINPVIEWYSEEKEIGVEGCLSLPGIHVPIERSQRIRLQAADIHGIRATLEVEGFEARVIQHEYDHLHGILILDHMSKKDRRESIRALREGREYTPDDLQ